MAEPYRSFGSFILFTEVLADELGHCYRAAEFDRTGIKRTVWLRLFDAPGVPVAELAAQADTTNRIGELLQAGNVATHPRLFVADGVPALAWDFVSGQPLSLILRKVRAEGFPVPVDNALLILEKLSLGLAAALAVEVGGSSLVHGFLHPGLVVVTHDGEGVVAGFGAADQLLGLLDRSDTAAAIRPYLAPEVLMTRTPTRRGDVYSLGAILFELLSGEPLPDQPEARIAVLDTAEMAYDEQPIPQDIKALLQRALATRPEERFSSAADFKKELDKLLYGGAYSPTTFNLALFMDRLFRSEIETEERERSAEATVDPVTYLQPEPAPVEEELATVTQPPARGRSSMGLWIAVAAGIAVVGIAGVLFLGRNGGGTTLPPTPTAEELEVQRMAEEAKIEAEVQRRLQEKEAELKARQAKIDEKEKKLAELQHGAVGGAETTEARRNREELERQIAAEKAAKLEQEKTLEDERQRQRALAQTATRTPSPTAALPVPTAPGVRPTVPPSEPTLVVSLEPTAAPTDTQPHVPPPVTTVTENMFVDPSQVDALPVVLKEVTVDWPRSALYSRRRGMIILQATVAASGRVDEVKVLRADEKGFGIQEAAVEAVKRYVFKPATKNGVNVKSHATVTIPYRFQTR